MGALFSMEKAVFGIGESRLKVDVSDYKRSWLERRKEDKNVTKSYCRRYRIWWFGAAVRLRAMGYEVEMVEAGSQ